MEGAASSKRRNSTDALPSRHNGPSDATPHAARKARKTKDSDGPSTDPGLGQQQEAGPSHGQSSAADSAGAGPSASTGSKKSAARGKKRKGAAAEAGQATEGEAGPSGQVQADGEQQQQQQQDGEAGADTAGQTSEQRWQAAVDSLTRLLCEDDSRRYFAEHALRTVQEQRPDIDQHPLEWVEEAQVWVACNNETEQEIILLREAMAASLAEAEARKAEEAKAVPEADALLLKHSSTQVLKNLSHVVCARVLAGETCEAAGVWKVLCKLLDHETKCSKWYPCPGTRFFYQRLAEELSDKLRTLITALKPPVQQQAAAGAAAGSTRAGAAAGPSSSKGDAAGGPGSHEPVLLHCSGTAGSSCCSCRHGSAAAAAAAGTSGAGSGATGTTPGSSSEALGEVWQQFKQLLEAKDAQIARGLAELPPKHVEQIGWVPLIFRLPDDAPPGAGVEVAMGGETKDTCIVVSDDDS